MMHDLLIDIYFAFKYIIQHIFWLCPIKENRIVFVSYYGKYYNDNPKAISDMIDRVNTDIIWFVDNPKEYSDDGIRFIRKSSVRSIYYLSTAAVWVDNCRKASWVRKRKGQHYIQCWHGSIGIKACERDAEGELDKHYLRNAKQDGKNADILISNGKWCSELYKRAFWLNGTIYEYGTPRLDRMINGEINKKEVCKKLRIQEKKILLYAPTYRNSCSLDVYNIDYGSLIIALNKQYGGDWVVLVRFHPNIKEISERISIPHVINVTDYPSIYDLIYISDFVISDYSSSFFEAAIIKKNIVLYTPDINEYKKERNLYFDLESLPFPLSLNNKQLVNALTNFNAMEYRRKLTLFLDELGLVEEGNASKKTAKLIKSFIN